MKGYGQFCPVAKATEVLGEKWTPLIIRELLSDDQSFNTLRKGVPLMSPSLLSSRLKSLEAAGVIDRLKTDKGVPVASSKFFEAHFENGKLVRVGNQFALGMKDCKPPTLAEIGR